MHQLTHAVLLAPRTRFHHEFLYKFLLSLKAEQYRMGFGVFGPANMVGMGIAINV